MVANHSTLAWDLYVIYAGQNPDTNRPIIKVFLNPLVAWIWIGVVIVIVGTLVALVPNLTTVLSLARPREPAKAQARPLVSEPATLRGGD
jgi:cytochrome c-type biogenesis protein CcmF